MHMVALISKSGFHPWLTGDIHATGSRILTQAKAAEICTLGPQPSDGDKTCTHLHGNVMFGINRKQTDTLSEVRM